MMKKSFLKNKDDNEEILEHLVNVIESFKKENLKEQTYIEPFLGVGNVFLNVEKYSHIILNDKNVAIFMLFQQIKNNPWSLIKDTKNLFIEHAKNKINYQEMINNYYSSKNYYHVCQELIYCNACCEQLIDFDNNKQYNNEHKDIFVPEKEIMLMHQQLSKNTIDIFNHSYETIFENTQYGDVIYCHQKEITRHEDIKENDKNLEKYAIKSCVQGAQVIISNTYNEITKELYKDCSEYYIKEIKSYITGKKIEKMIAIYA